MEGYNGTIFAYGQTGSGKTFTMYGDYRSEFITEESKGLIPRAAHQICTAIIEQSLQIENIIKISMVEIYKEKLRDLLQDPNAPEIELKIKEDTRRGTYVEGLIAESIATEEELLSIIYRGETMRHLAST